MVTETVARGVEYTVLRSPPSTDNASYRVFMSNFTKTALLGASLLGLHVKAEHLVSAGVSSRTELTSFLTATTLAPSVGYTFATGPFAIGAGARLGFALNSQSPSLVEGYLRGSLSGRVKAWAPMLGVEFGLSFVWQEPPTPDPTRYYAANVFRLARNERETAGPVYASIRAEVLRFAFGRFVLSAVAIDVGTNLAHPGATLRVGIEFINFGVRL